MYKTETILSSDLSSTYGKAEVLPFIGQLLLSRRWILALFVHQKNKEMVPVCTSRNLHRIFATRPHKGKDQAQTPTHTIPNPSA